MHELIGTVGYAIAFWAVASERDAHMRLGLGAACGINALYFWLSGMHLTAAAMLFTAARIAITVVWRPAWLAYIVIGSYLLIPFFIPGSDYLVIAAAIFGTCAVFFATGLRMRALVAICTGLLCANAAIGGAVAGAVGEGLILGMSLWRIQTLRAANTAAAAR